MTQDRQISTSDWSRSAPRAAPALAEHPPRDERHLMDQVHEALRARHYSRRTVRAYVGWIRRFLKFHRGRPVQDLGEIEISGFLTRAARRRRPRH